MSIECPSCGEPVERSSNECKCGWKLHGRGGFRVEHVAPAPRAPINGHFKSQRELEEYESQMREIDMNMRRRIADRKGELQDVPRHRRWAKEILIRVEEGDPRVTPTMHDMAKQALGVMAEAAA